MGDGQPTSGVLVMNLEALELMREGCYYEAATKLKIALSQVQSNLILLEQQSPGSTGTRPMTSFGGKVIIDHDHPDAALPSPVDINDFVSVNALPMNQICATAVPGFEGPFYLFNSGLNLSGLEESTLYSSSQSESRTAAVLCYNLALAFHLEALQGHNQEMNFRKALKLYNLVTTLVGVGSSNLRDHDDVLIRMSAVNNKGHVHFCLIQEEEVKASVEALFVLMENTPPRILGAVESSILPITLNMILHGEKGNHAPAA